jgi:hypothetical protein
MLSNITGKNGILFTRNRNRITKSKVIIDKTRNVSIGHSCPHSPLPTDIQQNIIAEGQTTDILQDPSTLK